MSFDHSIDVDKLNQEESVSAFIYEQCTSIASHYNNSEEKAFPDEEMSEIHQFDSNIIVVPGADEMEKFQEQNTVKHQSSYSINKQKKKLHNICISISSSSDEEENLSPKTKFTLPKKCTIGSDRRRTHIVESCDVSSLDVELPDLDDVPVVAQVHISDDKDQDEIEEIQQVQVIANENKKKVFKSTMKNIKKSNKPKSTLQRIHLDIDHCVLGLKDAELLWTSLRSMDISYSMSSNAVNFSILWQQKVNCEVSEDGKVTNTIEKCPEDYVMIIFTAENFIELVLGFKWNSSDKDGTNSILNIANYHKTLFPDKNITYAVIGIDKYFRNKKNRENQKYRSMARGSTSENSLDFPLVSFDDVEEVTVCLQIHEDIICHMVDTMEDLAVLIISFSKGIAEAPEKRKNRQNIFSWYAEGDTYKGVKVTNLNESLLQLWQQQIQQFSLVSKEVAEAIVFHYRSPQSLVEAYKSCTAEEGEMLLKDILVRRGVGPLAATKRIGPELSRKMYRFFTKKDESIIV